MPWLARGHGDVHEQIAAVSVEIERNPRDAGLHFKRAELHRVHRDWKLALADLTRASQLDPRLPNLEFCRGRLLFDANQFAEAKVTLDRELRVHPEHVEALLLRARAEASLNLRAAAIEDFSRAIALAREPQPDWFIERARLRATLGDDGIARALDGLDDGIKRLGRLVALQQTAIELELARRNFDGALARLDEITARSARKESWLAQRGDILVRAGRTGEAREAFAAALAAIETLPPAHRGTSAVTDLEKRIREQLSGLATSVARARN